MRYHYGNIFKGVVQIVLALLIKRRSASNIVFELLNKHRNIIRVSWRGIYKPVQKAAILHRGVHIQKSW